MPISKKYKHGDEVVMMIDGKKPLVQMNRHVIGKVIHIDHMYTIESKSIWRREYCKGKNIYKVPFAIVKWRTGSKFCEVDCVAEENLAPVPKAIKVLYGKV